MPYDILPLPAFTDNYIWAIIDRKSRRAAVIDPGDADVVLNAARQYQFTPCCILVTHHHWDHTAGVQILKEKYAIAVYGPDNPELGFIDYRLKHGDQINLADLSIYFEIIATPGHTLDHIVYKNKSWLFCGDTLFSAGCGRLFEGSAAQLYDSLCLLAALPDSTEVYCAHEYTLSNLRFALTVEPDNHEIQNYFEQIQKKRMNKPPVASLPTTIATEKLVNPFLRCQLEPICAAAEAYSQKKPGSPAAVFAVLRDWKNKFSQVAAY